MYRTINRQSVGANETRALAKEQKRLLVVDDKIGFLGRVRAFLGRKVF